MTTPLPTKLCLVASVLRLYAQSAGVHMLLGLMFASLTLVSWGLGVMCILNGQASMAFYLIPFGLLVASIGVGHFLSVLQDASGRPKADGTATLPESLRHLHARLPVGHRASDALRLKLWRQRWLMVHLGIVGVFTLGWLLMVTTR